MNQFTIKDFIEYGSPCRICQKDCMLRLVINGDSQMPSTIKGILVSFVTKVAYHSEKSSFIDINTKTNEYISNVSFTGIELYFTLGCGKCSYISTDRLELESGRIKPLTIYEENIIVETDVSRIELVSSMDNKSSIIYSRPINKPNNIPTRIVIPLLLISKWKTKEKLINNIVTYLAFS